jgi:hypothetical protein
MEVAFLRMGRRRHSAAPLLRRRYLEMVNKMFLTLAAVLATTSLATSTFAQGTPGDEATEPGRPTAPAEKPDGKSADKAAAEKEANGKVVSVNAAKKSLVMDVNGKKMTFAVAELAAKELTKFKRGDAVTVRYTEDGSTLRAYELTRS